MPVGPEQIRGAARRIAGSVRTTPTFTIAGGDLGDSHPAAGQAVANDGMVRLKLEHLQHSGSFKARGAANALLALDVPPAGVVAASGGNHGAAVAWAARQLGHRATIYVPTIASPTKLERLRAYGADVRVTGAVYADALAESQAFQASTGAVAIHAYDDDLVVGGAGTLGLELEAQIGTPDVVLVACGGGGLAGGLAAWFGTRTLLIVVETTGTGTFAAASAAGGPTVISPTGLAADSLGASILGATGWDALRGATTQSVLVEDDEVTNAQADLWTRYRLMVEPAAAAPMAALLTGKAQVDGARSVAVVICGANTSTGPST